jgi:hypothetical protein
MSKRNGRYYAALGGLILALLAGASIAQDALKGVPGAGNEKSAQDQPARAEKPTQAPLPAPVPAPEKAVVAAGSEGDAEAPENGGDKPSFFRDPVGWLGAWIFDPDNFSDFLMVLFTVALTVVAFKQHFLEETLAKDTGDALKIAKQSADAAASAAASTALLAETAARQADAIEASARAWMFFRDAAETKYGDNDIYEIHWENAGNATAVITGVALACHAATEPPDPAEAPMLALPAGAIVGPGGKWRRGNVFKRNFAADWDRAENIYLYGRIHYRDATSKERRTWFCRLYTGKQFVLDDITDWSRNGYD